MAATRKQIAFDLDTKALEKYYPTKNWRNAYEVIKQYMSEHEFKWRQGSVYISIHLMSDTVATIAISDLVAKNPWLNVCMRDCTVTNIGKEYSKNELFDKSAPIPMREETI
ncbi:MAG: hypothetical protein FWE86_02915 [Oscillospiraceae bacterium]|nr:hypothetical protein [Oscillospiraceae bacterium]